MADRYFVASPLGEGRAHLEGAEAHHFLHVMRGAVGDSVILFDGSGCECQAVVEGLGRREVTLKILSCDQVSREAPFPLVIGVALPKGERQKWLAEKLTELGVTRLVPLHCRRGVAQPTGAALERLERAVVEACKQCGRNLLMEIAPPQPWADFLAAAPAEAVRLVAHPQGSSGWEPRETGDSGRPIYAAIGPEGGFEAAEIELALQAGWGAVRLGASILRVETAAVALAALLACGREDR